MLQSPPGKLSRRAVLKAGAAIGAMPLVGIPRGFAQETVGNFPAGVSGPGVFVGLTVPLTGPYSAEGDDMQRGYKLGIKHLNNGGGLVSRISTLSGKGVLGKKIEYKIADTQTQPDPAVQAATNFITNNRAIMISGSAGNEDLQSGSPSASPTHLAGVCGKPWRPDVGQEFMLTEQLGCASLGLCAGLPPPLYPTQTHVQLLPMPREAGMRDPCAGVPRNSWWPAIS
jgi:hypothetical protein